MPNFQKSIGFAGPRDLDFFIFGVIRETASDANLQTPSLKRMNKNVGSPAAHHYQKPPTHDRNLLRLVANAPITQLVVAQKARGVTHSAVLGSMAVVLGSVVARGH